MSWAAPSWMALLTSAPCMRSCRRTLYAHRSHRKRWQRHLYHHARSWRRCRPAAPEADAAPAKRACLLPMEPQHLHQRLSAGEASLAASPEPAEADEPDAPAETPITADYVNRRISRLTARHRTAEKALQDEQQARAQERAELLGQARYPDARALGLGTRHARDAPRSPQARPAPSSTPVMRTTCWLQPATAPSKNCRQRPADAAGAPAAATDALPAGPHEP